MRPQFGTTYLLNPRPIRLKLFWKELSTSLIPALNSMPHTSTLFPAGLTHEPHIRRKQLVRKFFWLYGRTEIVFTSLTPSSLRFCTSVTLKSFFKISAYSKQNQKVSALHILCSQQVSDQLNISSACTVYIYPHVSLFIVFYLFIVFLFFCYLASLVTTQYTSAEVSLPSPAEPSEVK